jgi:HEPN domain-containing protein
VFDPVDEVRYRYKPAVNYLSDAEEDLSRGRWRNAVASAQLAAENAAKAVIAVYRIPSWSHDPSDDAQRA